MNEFSYNYVSTNCKLTDPGIFWYLKLEEKLDILTLSLISYNPLPDWTIQADIETSFLNQLGGENLTKVSKFTWKKKKPEAVYEHEIKRKELNDYFV